MSACKVGGRRTEHCNLQSWTLEHSKKKNITQCECFCPNPMTSTRSAATWIPVCCFWLVHQYATIFDIMSISPICLKKTRASAAEEQLLRLHSAQVRHKIYSEWSHWSTFSWLPICSVETPRERFNTAKGTVKSIHSTVHAVQQRHIDHLDDTLV